MLDPRLRGLLVCPSCRGEIAERDDTLVCAAEGLIYRVEGGVPWLVPELAQRERPAGERSPPRT